MVKPPSTQRLIAGALIDGRVRSSREIVEITGLSKPASWEGLRRCWVGGLVLRSEQPRYESERLNKGRAGRPRNTRPFHLYALRPQGVDRVDVDGRTLVAFSKSFLDARGGGSESKARSILEFLRSNSGKAFFSREIASSLQGKGVKLADIMANVRRYERRGLVYVRGYRTHDHHSPFREGYLITWIDQEGSRDEALAEAVDVTNVALSNRETTNPVIERVHRVRDLVLEATKLRDLVSFTYLHNMLKCSEREADNAVARAIQLYPDLRELKLFGAYRYYHHASMSVEDLNAATQLKINYVRQIGSRRFRIGHNWEAVAEWFIDRFTTGAEFQSQQHRSGAIDPRRITLYLIKSVGGRRSAAEVDRVWTVTPGIFAPPVTYVLSCKWGIVHKGDVDDFMEVLRWSKEFGVDTSDGRQVRQGVMGVFAAGAFNPRENVKVNNGTTIPLPSYAARTNIQLLKASDFNSKLRERGCLPTVNVQATCRLARDEKEVRQMLDLVWKDPNGSDRVLHEAESRNSQLYEFEKKLDSTAFA